jgi:hypothetical protein
MAYTGGPTLYKKIVNYVVLIIKHELRANTERVNMQRDWLVLTKYILSSDIPCLTSGCWLPSGCVTRMNVKGNYRLNSTICSNWFLYTFTDQCTVWYTRDLGWGLTLCCYGDPGRNRDFYYGLPVWSVDFVSTPSAGPKRERTLFYFQLNPTTTCLSLPRPALQEPASSPIVITTPGARLRQLPSASDSYPSWQAALQTGSALLPLYISTCNILSHSKIHGPTREVSTVEFHCLWFVCRCIGFFRCWVLNIYFPV